MVLAESGDNNKRKAVCLMLMRYALESLAKGIILSKAYNAHLLGIKHSEEELRGWKYELKDGKKRNIDKHELEKLYEAKDLGFKVNDSEIDLLKDITAYILWKGRYSVPLRIDKLPSSEPNFDDMFKVARDVYERAIEEARKLKAK